MIGRLICWLARGHKWRKAYGVDDTSDRVKECRRCGIVRAVKPRKPKAP